MNPSLQAKAIQEVGPLLLDLLKAENRIKSFMCVANLTTFLETGEDEKIFSFCVEGWQVGRSIFTSSLQLGLSDVAKFPETMRLAATGIATLWSQEFVKHPKIASVGLLYAETKLWQKGDKAGDWWTMWLHNMLNHSLGKDVQIVMSQYLQKR